jgi:hypothetical protein
MGKSGGTSGGMSGKGMDIFSGIVAAADPIHKNLESSISELLNWQDRQRQLQMEQEKMDTARRQGMIGLMQDQQQIGQASIGQLAALRNQAVNNTRGRMFRNSMLQAIGG